MDNSNPNYFFEGSSEKKTKKIFLIFPWLVCLFCAFGIWLYVMNMSSGTYEKTFTLIDVSVEGAEALENLSNLSLVDVEGGKISVTVTGLRSDIAELTSKDFEAYVDISTLNSAGKHVCDIKLKPPATVSVKSKEPSSISVSVDMIKVVEVPVTVEKSSYSMNANFYLGEITTDISSVKVEGPGTVLDRIVAARAEIGLGKQLIETSLTQRLELTLVDADGKVVDSPYVTANKTSVTVDVPVLTDAIVPLKYTFAEGYDVSLVEKVELSIPTVKITGDPLAVSKISEIVVFTIDETICEETLVDVADFLPAGVSVNGEAYVTMKVTFAPDVPDVPDVPDKPDVPEGAGANGEVNGGEETNAPTDAPVSPEKNGESADVIVPEDTNNA